MKDRDEWLASYAGQAMAALIAGYGSSSPQPSLSHHPAGKGGWPRRAGGGLGGVVDHQVEEQHSARSAVADGQRAAGRGPTR